ncbi:MAG: C10 family peptidase, partial [Bacteroidales bacterium]|nr:C10 family peptidase [Bacteroidales bacterium]
MKRLYTILLLSLVCGILRAAPVDSITAKRVAANFMAGKTNATHRYAEASLAFTGRTTASATRNVSDCFYIYNIGEGFVIVSADDRMVPVLGYSTEGRFNFQDIPENMASFLENYKAEASFILNRSGNEARPDSRWRTLLAGRPSSTTRGTVLVGPLLTTNWGQSPLFNALCPADSNGQAVTGCVATAMGQIIRYWRFPTHGIGSHSYTSSDYGTQTADFGNTTYNYADMPNTLTNNNSQAQINAVATLLYHCGVSVDMQYGVGASGAASATVPYALSTYFGYPESHYYHRNNFNEATWISMLKNDLDHSRPILYSGSGNAGGHAFVCDGYNDEDYFHINWGWKGSYNGYFLISALSPSSYEFNTNQGAVLGIDGGSPILHCSLHDINFYIQSGTYSDPVAVNFVTGNLTSPLQVTCTGNFTISTDSTTYHSAITLPATGGRLYVRYQPVAQDAVMDSGMIIIGNTQVSDTILLTGGTYVPDCSAPQDLHITTNDNQHINLSWSAPPIADDPQTFSWCEQYAGTAGYRDSYNIYILHRMASSDLVPYHQKQLSEISFVANEGASVYKIIVFTGGSYENNILTPGTLVCEQTVNQTPSYNYWNTVTLDNPVFVDASQELWYGIYLEASAGQYCMGLGYGEHPGKGNILGYVGGSSVSWSCNSFSNMSYAVRATFKNTPITPNNFSVYRDNVLLATVTDTFYNDLLSETRDYLYRISANWNNGCSASVQQSFRNESYISVQPDHLAFYTNYGRSHPTHTIEVSGVVLNQPIQATVVGPFTISSNLSSMGSSATLPATGGTIHVQYSPISDSITNDYGFIALSSGNITDTVWLEGHCFEKACPPPTNLTLAQNNRKIDLQWDAPVYIPTSYPITWDSVITGFTYYSTNLPVEYLQRYESSDLTAYHNKNLTSISFYAITGNSYKIMVYTGGVYTYNGLTPDVKVVEQTVSSFQSGWNTIILDQPVRIDTSKELWFGISVQSDDSTPLVGIGSEPLLQNKNFVGYPFSSGISWFSANSNNFALKGTLTDDSPTILEYDITRNDILRGSTIQTSYSDPITQNILYRYAVTAVWDNGCRSSATDTITASGIIIPPSIYTTIDSTVCSKQLPFVWNGQSFSDSGEKTITLEASNGADSILTMRLTVNLSASKDEYLTLCDNELPYRYVNGQIDTTFGIGTPSLSTPNFKLSTIHGCDSIITLHFTVNYGTHNVVTEIACESFTWHGHTYTSSGTYTHAYTNADGCASVDTLKLTVHYGTHNVVTETACESFIWHGHTYTSSGTYTHAYTNTNGCASVDTLKLTVNYGTHNVVTETACESFTWHGQTYTSSGTFTHAYTNTNGCASVDTLKLTVNHGTHNVVTETACESFTWHGHTYTSSGTYTHAYTNSNGCASVDTLKLTVNYGTHNVETETACESYTWHGQTYTSSGTYTHAYTNSNGCASVDTLKLTVHYGTHNVITETACESLTWHGQTYTNSGTYTHVYTNGNGCASVDTLKLTVNYGTHNVITETACESFTWHGQTYTSSGTYTHAYTNSNGCASVDTLKLTVNYGTHNVVT